MRFSWMRRSAALAVMTVVVGLAADEAFAQYPSTAPVGTPTGRVAYSNRTISPEVRRTQDTTPPAPAPGGETAAPEPGGAGTDLPSNTDLSLPAAEREQGGGGPTTEEARQEEEEAAEPTLLMKWLGMDDSPNKIYGWIQNSYTGNTNGKPASGENFGVNPNHRANSWQGNQYYLILENPIEQEDEFNLGYRIDNLFGNDWQFNYMQGFLNRAFKLNSFSGYDIAQFYVEAHMPILTEGGVDVKVGRIYTLAGYEVVPAIGRPLLSVPYMFNYGQPFTHMGVMTTTHLTDRINLHNCAINGWDRFIDQSYKWGYMGGLSWSSEDEKTSLSFIGIWGPNQYPRQLPANQQIYPTGYINVPSIAGLQNPGYSRNDRTLFTTVLSHKWTDKLTQVMETDQGFERGIPGLGSGGRNGATASAQWYSFGNWFLYSLTDKLTGVWRAEVFQDAQGARTGTLKGDNYYEMTLGLIYKPESWLWIRPEARYDWAQYHTPYNDGTRGSQLTLAFDVIFLF